MGIGGVRVQDRFKFRVWDKENKCLYYPTRYSNFSIVNGTVVKIESYPTANSAYLGKRIAWEFDNAVIMQCTGLKDKNGKLIYEGDIVKQGDIKYVVNWLEGTFCFLELETSHNFTIEYVMPSKQEVIGNIYQNPELLED